MAAPGQQIPFRVLAFETVVEGNRSSHRALTVFGSTIFLAFPKDIFSREQAIQGRREPGIDSHLDDNFQNLLARCPHIHRSMNVDLELRRGIGHCRECRDRRELSGLKIETGAAVHVPEGETRSDSN